MFHIAERHPGLRPQDANARARAMNWMFAALSTVGPPILELQNAKLLEGDKPWSAEGLPPVLDRIRDRLKPLSVRLADADWLDGAFSAADLLMVSVSFLAETIGHPERISEPGCLCGLRRRAPRLPASVRGAARREQAREQLTPRSRPGIAYPSRPCAGAGSEKSRAPATAFVSTQGSLTRSQGAHPARRK